MYFYPNMAPLPSAVVWAGDTVGLCLMVAGLVGAFAVAALILQAGRRRAVRPAPTIKVVSPSIDLPRAAA
jgi:hypothetical protein